MATRTRRPTAEVRRLLVEAAARVFKARGFAATTADDIAAEAGVARSAIWKHFDDKADLFGAAVLQPFAEFLESHGVAYEAHQNPHWDDVEITRTIVGLCYDACVAHREALLGVAVAGGELGEPTVRELQKRIDGFFSEITRTTELEAERRGRVPEAGLALTMRLLFGAIASAVVFDQPLVPSGAERPTREQLVEHVTLLFLYGATLAPPPRPRAAAAELGVRVREL